MGKVLSPKHSLPRVGKVASGASRIGYYGMKESEEMHLKQAIYESTRAPLARSPFPDGEGCETRMPLSHAVIPNP